MPASVRKSPAGELIELRDRALRVFHVSGFQVRLGQQIQVLRLIWMLLHFVRQLCQVQLIARAGGEIGAIVEIVEQVLKRKGTTRGVL